MGWIRAVLVDGRDVMPDALASDAVLERAYPTPLFSKTFLRELGLLPTDIFSSIIRPAKRSAGPSIREYPRQLIRKLENRLLQSLAEAGGNEAKVLDAYDLYLASRNASYIGG